MSTTVSFEFLPNFRKYTDGRVERLQSTDVVPPSLDPKTRVDSKDIVIPVTPVVPVRIYKPTTFSCHKLPLVFYIHGGAFFVATPYSIYYQNLLNAFAAETNTIVVSIHYGRAPEEPLPAAYDQCWSVIQSVTFQLRAGGGDEWLRHYADPHRVFIAGESAGANIAHNIGIRAGEEKMKHLKLGGIMLLCPYIRGKHPIPGETTDQKDREVVDESWRLACPSTMGSDDPWFNPVKDPKFSKLGSWRVLVCVAGKDTYKYRGWYYYENLGKSGWGGAVEIMETEGEGHAFFLGDPDSPNAKALLKRVASFIHAWCRQSDPHYIE